MEKIHNDFFFHTLEQISDNSHDILRTENRNILFGLRGIILPIYGLNQSTV